MKKNKSILALASLVFVLGLTSCGQTNTSSSSNANQSSSSEPETNQTTSSSSTSVYENHTVTVNQVEGVTIAVDKQEALCGDVVTVTLSGYDVTLKEVTLTADSELEFTKVETQTGVEAYTFVMPDNAVSLSATVENKTYQAYAYYLDENSYTPITFTYTINGEVVDAKEILPGKTVKIKASGFSSSVSEGSTMYLYVDDVVASGVVASEKDGNDNSVSYVEFSFTMPAHDAKIYICKPIGTIDNKNGKEVTIVNGDGVKVLGVKAGDKYTFSYSGTIFYVCEEGYLFDVEVKDQNETSLSSYKYSLSSVENGYYSSLYGIADKSLTITITSEYNGVRNITYVGKEGIISVNGNENYQWPTTYTVGKDFSVSSLVVAEGQYISSISIVGADGTVVKEDKDAPTYLYFSMPDQDVTITFTFANNGNITWAEDLDTSGFDELIIGSSYTYSSSKENPITSSAPNEYVYVHVKLKDGYMLNTLNIKTDDGKVDTQTFSSNWNDNTLYYASFRMPGSNVELSIDYSKKYTITKGESASVGCYISYAPESQAAGKEAYFSVNTVDKFHYLAMVVATYDGEDHVWTLENGGLTSNSGSYYYFIMPAANLTLTPYFGENEALTVSVSADEAIQSFTVSTSETYTYAYSAGDMKVSANENIMFAASNTDSSKFVRVIVTDTSDVEHVFDPISVSTSTYGSTIYYSYDSKGICATLESGAKVKSVNFTLVERSLATVTVTNDIENLAITYKVNGTDATDLSGVKQYDYIDFVLDSSKCETGYKYNVEVTDGNGNAITYNQSQGGYVVTSTTINVTAVKSLVYKSSVTYTPETPAMRYINWYVNNSYSSADLDGAELAIGDKVRITSITFYTSTYSTYDYSLTVTNGDETVGTYTADGFYALENGIEFTVKGNVTFAFTVSLD